MCQAVSRDPRGSCGRGALRYSCPSPATARPLPPTACAACCGLLLPVIVRCFCLLLYAVSACYCTLFLPVIVRCFCLLLYAVTASTACYCRLLPVAACYCTFLRPSTASCSTNRSAVSLLGAPNLPASKNTNTQGGRYSYTL
jgi:hypothetical protein